MRSWPGLSRPSTPCFGVERKTWMPATSAGMTPRVGLAQHQSHIPRRHAADRIGDAAVGALECVDALHLFIIEREIEHCDVLSQPSRIGRARNRRDDLLLDQPAERHLRDGLALLARDL